MLSLLIVWTGLVLGQSKTLDTSTLNSLSVKTEEVNAKAVPGSNVLLTAFDVEKAPATQFIIDRFLQLEKIVQNYDKLNPAQKKEVDQKIRQIVSSVLDLSHLGKRAMLTYWDEMSKTKEGQEQLNEYIKLFKNLVEENYLEKARTYVSGKYQIPLIEEETQGGFTFVRGKIKKEDVDLLLEFKLVNSEKDFKIVDVKLDETSLEATYRSSFNRIIRKKGGLKEGFPELLRVMSKRLEELKQGEATRL